MKVLDAGHRYSLRHLDGNGEQILQFVKREGPGYPGNVGHCEGTTMQENLRAIIDRALYVNAQIPDPLTEEAVTHMELAVWNFEVRAAQRHGRRTDFLVHEAVYGETCPRCGHVGCDNSCHHD